MSLTPSYLPLGQYTPNRMANVTQQAMDIGVGLADAFVRNRSTAFRGARAFQKVWRGYRARRRFKGRTNKFVSSTRNPFKPLTRRATPLREYNNIAIDNKFLYKVDITKIDRILADQSNVVQARLGEVIHLSSWKICWEIKNNTTEAMYFNWAVIQPKNSISVGNTFGTQKEFFRANGNHRAVDFDTTLAGLDLHCLSINTDKFKVLTHKRFTLAGIDSTTETTGNKQSFLMHEQIVKLNKILRYDDQESVNDVLCTTPYYMVFWADNMFSPNSNNVTEIAVYNCTVIAYFTNAGL